MAIDLSRLRDGDLFEAAFVVDGLIVEVLAEVEIAGTTLHLRDEALRITGTRLPGSNPGRIVDLTMDLSRDAR